ncbi:2'-5' RNA ligase family protein [Labrys wisconsinensis]|uniref:2'-5' RNA ligase n=1 Tax=Labrys wisconsinensis TaxID=425677 RepID=A0ABU0J6E2_9HYPH|nr:2'-5' RNA ligase family protein [Labrys wisconsinensis]MDQ0469818.1 2'-5' RNA ligase [Labrys wisconsinensis]
MQPDLPFDDPLPEQRAPERRTFERRPSTVSPWHPPIPGLEMKRLDRLFFALRLGPQAGSRALEIGSRIRPQAGRSGSWTGLDRLHATLHMADETEGLRQSRVAMALEAGAMIRLPAFDVAFGRLDAWPDGAGGAHLVLLCDVGRLELEALRRDLGAAMRQAGFRRFEKRFDPHVTLRYGGRPLAPREVGPVQWTVQDFALIHSQVGLARHDVKRCWPLA